MVQNKRASVFAAYQVGTGINSKMVDDECKNLFQVTFSTIDEMIREIEGILEARHACEVLISTIIIVHHFHCYTHPLHRKICYTVH